MFVTEGAVELVVYMLSLPGIRDIKMEDGTTAFSMALGKRHLKLIKAFLCTVPLSENDPIAMSKRAILDMDRLPEKNDPDLRAVLLDGLRHNNVPIGHEPSQIVNLSEE